MLFAMIIIIDGIDKQTDMNTQLSAYQYDPTKIFGHIHTLSRSSSKKIFGNIIIYAQINVFIFYAISVCKKQWCQKLIFIMDKILIIKIKENDNKCWCSLENIQIGQDRLS